MEKLLEKYIDKFLKTNNYMKNFIKVLCLLVLVGACNTNENSNSELENFKSLELINRVEPPNWWTGMKTLDLQLLVYGNNINDLVPKINNSNIIPSS